jgi:hypothetical protein
MKKFLKCTASILAGLCVFAACSDDPENDVVTIYVDHSSLDLFVGDVVAITASPTELTFNWESSNTAVATVSNGTVTAAGVGTANITVSFGTASKIIPVTVTERIPATGISVSQQSVELQPGQTVTVTATLIPENNNEQSAILWQSSHPAVATVTAGLIEAIGFGSATVTVYLEDNPAVKTEISVLVVPLERTTIDLSTFADAGNNLIQGQVSFENGVRIVVNGLADPSTIGTAYNRDFFSYDPASGMLAFIGETGTYDVYYSGKYNYFWVAKMSDSHPATFWIIGNGFTCAPQWHSDFNPLTGGNVNDIRQMAYMKPLENNQYQATIYISLSHDWGDVEIQLKPVRTAEPERLALPTLTGDSAGLSSMNWGIYTDSSTGFVPGYFRVTMDLSNVDLSTGTGAVVNFERLN